MIQCSSPTFFRTALLLPRMVGELKMPFLVGSQRSKSRCRCASSSSGVNWASGWEGKGTGVRREEGEEGEERRGEERRGAVRARMELVQPPRPGTINTC